MSAIRDKEFDTSPRPFPFEAERECSPRPRVGLDDIAPLGQTRWPEQLRIVAGLDALQAEVDALKRLQAETAAKGKAEILKAETLK
jgi:hypothetical protein